MEIESRLVGAWGWGQERLTANENEESFWDDRNVLNWTMLTATQFYKFTKNWYTYN